MKGNVADKFKAPAIVMAAMNGRADIIKELIKSGVDVNARLNTGMTTLYAAVRAGEVNIVRMLLQVKGIDVNLQAGNGDSPLSLAARSGSSDIVRLLLKAGARIHHYEELIHRVESAGHKDTASILKAYHKAQGSEAKSKCEADKTGQFFDSSRCIEDLSKHKLISHYAGWSDKEQGVMRGAVLYGLNKLGLKKKVFVKSYRDGYGNGGWFDELIDYAGFTIMKRCGVRAPKVKLKGVESDERGTGERVYMFSTDLAQQNTKHPGKQYRYFDASELQNFGKVTNGSFHPSNNFFKQNKRLDCPLDPISAARAVMLAVILGISDLHSNNTGYVVSHDKGIAKTKLAIVDFCNSAADIWIPAGSTLSDFIQRYKAKFYELEEFQKVTTEEDYIKGFERIELNFLSTCDEVLETVMAVPFETEKRKEGFAKTVEIWKKNFEKVRVLVDAAKQQQNLQHEVAVLRRIGKKTVESPVDLDKINRAMKRGRR